MSKGIPQWADYYAIGGTNKTRNIWFFDSKPHTLVIINGESCDVKPIENLARDLEIEKVCQQIKDKPLHSRIDVIGQNGPTGAHYDEINPDHYKQGDIECIDAIESALTKDEYRGYLKGNMIKYTWRERFKQQATAIEKAVWYAERLIKLIKEG